MVGLVTLKTASRSFFNPTYDKPLGDWQFAALLFVSFQGMFTLTFSSH